MAKIHQDHIDKFHDSDIYVPTRTLFLGSVEVNLEGESGTDAAMAARAIKNLHILDTLNQEPITIIMNNPGGSVVDGMAIYDAIRACQSHVTVKVFGQASSMGSIILQAADERIMSSNSVQLIHYGTFSIDTDCISASNWINEDKRVNLWLEEMYMNQIKKKHPTFRLTELKRLLGHDNILPASKSVEIGLADKILGEVNE